MKNKISLLLAGFGLSVLLCSCVSTSATAQKIAIVDVQAVVNKSEQVQALKQEQQSKMQALEQWIKDAQSDVEKKELQADKDELVRKYNDELAKRRDAITKEYQEKLQEIDDNDVQTMNLLGQYYIVSDEAQKAEDCFANIKKIDPNYNDLYRDWAERFIQKGDEERAEPYLL